MYLYLEYNIFKTAQIRAFVLHFQLPQNKYSRSKYNPQILFNQYSKKKTHTTEHLF